MVVELKTFGQVLFPKDKAVKKTPDLKPLAVTVKASSKEAAAAIGLGKLAEQFPAHIGDYFKPKVWEDRPGLPRAPLDTFCADFFETVAIWNAGTGEPEPLPVEPEDIAETDETTPALKAVAPLGQCFRAAALVLFGPVSEITDTQYGQVVDLVNDDEGGQLFDLYEAINHTPWVLALYPERQETLLAYTREKSKPSFQWPDYKKLMEKWRDMQHQHVSADRHAARTPSGATAGGRDVTDRIGENTPANRDFEIALGLRARRDEFDIYNVPLNIELAAGAMVNNNNDPEYIATRELFDTMPGNLDYSRACIIAAVKTTPEGLYEDRPKHREHINAVLIESDHANPDPVIVDIACGRSSMPMPKLITKKMKKGQPHDEAGQNEGGKAEGTANQLPQDDGKKQCETDKHPEVEHHVSQPASSITDTSEWDQKVSDLRAGKAISFEPVKVSSNTAVTPAEERSARNQGMLLPTSALTYEQQLTISALQGLCANPVHGNFLDDLASMAAQLAAGVVRLQEAEIG